MSLNINNKNLEKLLFLEFDKVLWEDTSKSKKKK